MNQQMIKELLLSSPAVTYWLHSFDEETIEAADKLSLIIHAFSKELKKNLDKTPSSERPLMLRAILIAYLVEFVSIWAVSGPVEGPKVYALLQSLADDLTFTTLTPKE